MNTLEPAKLKEAAKLLPPSPQIFGKLSKLLKDTNTGLGDITELVNTDSSLTTQVLRLSNSAFFNQGSSVDTLDEAINRIGFRELFKLVGMAAASQVFSRKNVTYDVDGSLLWENSLAVGLAMEILANATGADEQEAYTLGLLRSMGKMVIDLCAKEEGTYPSYESNSPQPLIEWEENNFGITNPIVSGFLLNSWNFPEETAKTIQFQYDPNAANHTSPNIRLLNISNGIAERIDKALPGESSYWDLSEGTLTSFNLTQDKIDDTCERVKDGLEQVVTSVAA